MIPSGGMERETWESDDVELHVPFARPPAPLCPAARGGGDVGVAGGDSESYLR